MHVNLFDPILDLKETVILLDPSKPDDPANIFTLERCCADALMDQNDKLTGQQRYDRAKLCQKIVTAAAGDGIVEFSAEQVAETKAAIGLRWPAVVVMRAWDLLEAPKSPEGNGKTKTPRLTKK